MKTGDRQPQLQQTAASFPTERGTRLDAGSKQIMPVAKQLETRAVGRDRRGGRRRAGYPCVREDGVKDMV